MQNLNSESGNELDYLIPDNRDKIVTLGLERITKFLIDIGCPCKDIPAIQIAGTNGKGSIASFLKSSLKAIGIRAGVTTSPHLISWRERIQVDEELISIENFRKIYRFIESKSRYYKLSTFEIIIGIALHYFASKNVELLVLEAGLGGRLDATTAHQNRPIIALGRIGLDHCEFLGESIQEITKEKLAIIGKNSLVISAQQDPEVAVLIEKISRSKNAQIKWVEPLTNNWDLGIPGDIQRENAAVAKGVLEGLSTLGWDIKENKVKEGLSKAKWSGRMERMKWRGKAVLIDGAHNPLAAKVLSLERQKWKGQELGINWILGIQSNKNAPEIIKVLIKQKDLAWIIPIPDNESWGINNILDFQPSYSKQLIPAKNIEEALFEIFEDKKLINTTPVISGSLYLIANALSKGILA